MILLRYTKLRLAQDYFRDMTDFSPEIAIVAGSGLGELSKIDRVEFTVNFSDISGFPVSTVSGHKGRFVFGYIKDKSVVVMEGRVHFYEGYTPEEVVMPIRFLGMLGVKKVILTNAAGGINENFIQGDIMLITDHISFFAPSPLLGKNVEQLGTRFPDMTEVYSKRIREIIINQAKEMNIDLKQGVYVQTTGPQYETPAEIRMLKTLGADAVGMSTVPEAIAGKHMSMEICGISLITNMAAGISKQPLTHEEVYEISKNKTGILKELIFNSITSI